jgi:uncharacterized protein (DUF849 family)
MLRACLNGGLAKTVHASVSVSASELAADAPSVRAAGAAERHIHVRDHEGAETLDPNAVASCLTAIREGVPGMPVGTGTCAWIAPGRRAGHRDMRAWSVAADYCSVNLNEEDAVDVTAPLDAHGIGVEAGLWDRRDAESVIGDVPFGQCLRVLIEMTSNDGAAAVAEARHKLPILLHGEGGSVCACVREAARLGCATRVGFEDGLCLPAAILKMQASAAR